MPIVFFQKKRNDYPLNIIIYGRRHLINMEERMFWRRNPAYHEGNPRFARESKLVCGKSKGSPKRGLPLTQLDYFDQ